MVPYGEFVSPHTCLGFIHMELQEGRPTPVPNLAFERPGTAGNADHRSGPGQKSGSVGI